MSRAPTAECRLPSHSPHQRIGLFGGSFNPPHEGHVLVSLMALRRLRLDAVWWLVTPGNPLKDKSGLPPLEQRLALARTLIRHPRLKPTGVEAALGTVFTAETLAKLRQRSPQARFVWIMGADNLAQFHRWKGWHTIARLMPIAVIDRPGFTHKALHSRAAIALLRGRVKEYEATTLSLRRPPAWVFLHGRRSSLSSTSLRKR